MTSTSGVVARRRGGLRRQWRRAFFVVAAALLLALAGVTATYLQTASRYQSAARHLDAAITKTSQLNAAVNDHEIQSHKLWQGTRIDRAAFLRGQNQITGLFRISQRDLRGTGEQALVTHAWHVWQEQLTSRGLWGPEAGPRRGGVTGSYAGGIRQRTG